MTAKEWSSGERLKIVERIARWARMLPHTDPLEASLAFDTIILVASASPKVLNENLAYIERCLPRAGNADTNAATGL